MEKVAISFIELFSGKIRDGGAAGHSATQSQIPLGEVQRADESEARRSTPQCRRDLHLRGAWGAQEARRSNHRG